MATCDNAPQKCETVLLVEDEPVILLTVGMMLKHLGFAVREARNGSEALELYRQNHAEIDLVLTDVGMPIMDGFELFKELQGIDPELPVFIASGNGDFDIASRFTGVKPAGVLIKPFSFEDLKKMLVKHHQA